MSRKTHTILVVDDEKEFLGLMESLLSEEGYKVVSCLDGEKALEELKRDRPFSVIISDYKMPILRGTDFLEHAKKLAQYTPRIMITAYQNAKMMEESINKAEVFRFLTKPVDIDTMLETIQLAVDKYEAYLEFEKKINKKTILFKR